MAKASTKNQLQALAARTNDCIAGVASTAAGAIREITTVIPGQMIGATSDAAGQGGTVPAPAVGSQQSYMRGDGTWSKPIIVSTGQPTDTAAIWFRTNE